MRRISIICILACCMFATLPAVAQKSVQRYIDSLLKELPRAKEDTNKGNMYYNLSTSYFSVNVDKGINYGQQGVDLATRLGWKSGISKLANTLGNCLTYKKDYAKAIDFYLKSLKASEELNDKHGQALVLKNIGNVYSYKTKDYQKAGEYYLRCIKVNDELGDARESADVLAELASMYQTRRDFAKATDYFKQAMAKGESLGDKRIVAENLGNISLVYKSQANYGQAIDYALQSQKFYEAAGDKKGIASALYKAGLILNLQKDYQKAMDYFLRSLKLAEETGKKDLVADNLRNAADVYISQGDYPHALQFSLRSFQIEDGFNDKSSMGANLMNIGKCYYSLADNKGRGQIPDSLTALPVPTRLQRAHYYLAKAIDLQKETGEYGMLEESYELLSKVQYMEGDKEGSQESFKQHNLYLESMYNQDKSNEVARKDMQYVFNKKQETLKQESQEKETAMAKEMQLNSLRHEYEMKQAAATSEKEREQLKYEEELKQKQITFEFERKQAGLEAQAAVAKAELDKTNALNAAKTEQAKKERIFYIICMVLFAAMSVVWYNRFKLMRENKKVLEEKNKQIAAEKETAELMRERAENSEKFKQMFLANMSHEIRTPMNAVGGMTEILLEKNPRPDQISYLQAISKSSDVLLHIINDILDLSKIEAGKMELEAIDFSLSDTVMQVKDTLSHRADEKGLHLTIDVHKDVNDVVVGDPFRLNQVLINLGGNAIKFTERGGVQIELRPEKVEGNFVDIRFSIIDTGIGIPADKIASLFGNFSQVNSSDTRKYGGTGLGLSISKQLVELHGGKINIESVLGSGTTFYFIIRYPKGSPEVLEERVKMEKKADGSILNGLRILVADDNEYNRIVVNETLLLKADVVIDNVVNGQEALDAVRKGKYDVVLMDVQMPVMNGLDATMAIRKLKAPNKDVPIIALTASTLRNDIDKCINSGMNSYVPKPFKAWQLINTIADITGRKRDPNAEKGAATGRKGKENEKSKEAPKEAVFVEMESTGDGLTITDAAYLYNFCEGDEKRIKKYIAMYLKGVNPFIEKLNEVVAAKDMKEIALRIHAFKPNMLIMGMRSTGELGTKIEQLCTENSESVYECINELLDHVARSVKELEARA
jgi:signal transduction histidine kinase/CheY-like chemotaxis protein/tetratricopeptide (TPR) repeat protein/HPt (histidine-containing phosphotransfer) domain-containing protein